MGLFDGLFGRKKQAANDPLEKVSVLPGLELSKALADYWPQMEATKRASIKIIATPVEDPHCRKNSFGCYPTIPRGFAYPRDENGNFLYPLAQLHCADMPPLAGYPDSGYLQFYIAVKDNDVYGLDFDDQVTQKNFRVLYFEENDVWDPETDFDFLAEIIHSDYSPVNKPHSLEFALQTDYLGANEIAFDANTAFLEKLRRKYPQLVDDFGDELYDSFPCNGHKLGGYAYFTQNDPRQYNAAYKDWLLLFQMDSDEDIMWGDVGVGNFFIPPDNLKRKDFSTILYNFDCS
ncbi:YwqG family protein [Puia dinghuensis]|uniref:DUF1963 domain-containing protein n=1 Tax=Puia dinghuensis TaxID=1792502 RepID=A0A8J2UE99_9BACT|nr:YwqG family protein [Puia dinghuensis]GGB04608.1 hypothetical protein GCM10011511_29870 [Puia dinghuensis]